MLFYGCLDIPHSPEQNNPNVSFSVYAVQNGDTNTNLKIHPESEAYLNVLINPTKVRPYLNFYWFNQNDSLLGEGTVFKIKENFSKDSIPSKLKIVDSENNYTYLNFSVIVNSPPTFLLDNTPVEGDVLYGNSSTSFPFTWKAKDLEDVFLDYIFELDSNTYFVGSLESVKQSGLLEGEHVYRLIVFDSVGDSDTLPYVHFWVQDTLERTK